MTMRPRSHHRTMQDLQRRVRAAQSLGLLHQHTGDAALDGRTITLQGRQLVTFASCSYLGLELEPRITAAAVDATERYGTTFSSSRAYVSLGLYEELEALLAEIFGAAVIVTPTTTLGHLAAVPALVDRRDAVVIDAQAHESMQMVAGMLAGRGTTLEKVRHNDMAQLDEVVGRLGAEHPRVWYLADGVYSMYGDLAPVGALEQLLVRHPSLRVYLDDAHGMSWTGGYGRGHVAEHLGVHPRAVVAVSLSKSFGAGGAAIVFGDPDERERVLFTGQTLIFGGPVPPASLGAAVASARLHASGEIHVRQAALRDRIRDADEGLRQYGLPVVSREETPITFVGVGSEQATTQLHRRLADDGFFVNAAAHPAVPPGESGLRFTTTLHQRLGDIEQLVAALARHLPAVLAPEGRSVEQIAERFARVTAGRGSTVPV